MVLSERGSGRACLVRELGLATKNFGNTNLYKQLKKCYRLIGIKKQESKNKPVETTKQIFQKEQPHNSKQYLKSDNQIT
jgi:hypothetical protein